MSTCSSFARIALRLSQIDEERAIQQREWALQKRAFELEKLELQMKYSLLQQRLSKRRNPSSHDKSAAKRQQIAVSCETEHSSEGKPSPDGSADINSFEEHNLLVNSTDRSRPSRLYGTQQQINGAFAYTMPIPNPEDVIVGKPIGLNEDCPMLSDPATIKEKNEIFSSQPSPNQLLATKLRSVRVRSISLVSSHVECSLSRHEHTLAQHLPHISSISPPSSVPLDMPDPAPPPAQPHLFVMKLRSSDCLLLNLQIMGSAFVNNTIARVYSTIDNIGEQRQCFGEAKQLSILDVGNCETIIIDRNSGQKLVNGNLVIVSKPFCLSSTCLVREQTDRFPKFARTTWMNNKRYSWKVSWEVLDTTTLCAAEVVNEGSAASSNMRKKESMNACTNAFSMYMYSSRVFPETSNKCELHFYAGVWYIESSMKVTSRTKQQGYTKVFFYTVFFYTVFFYTAFFTRFRELTRFFFTRIRELTRFFQLSRAKCLERNFYYKEEM
ncbi:uncharacterized protein LOC134287531 [Aedes albopictus]|uniref:Uncharacterized protein n=1 Tax=Aedes albopictus TaxID=7160 RepID=A0ABM1ZXG3_AEDAL